METCIDRIISAHRITSSSFRARCPARCAGAAEKSLYSIVDLSVTRALRHTTEISMRHVLVVIESSTERRCSCRMREHHYAGSDRDGRLASASKWCGSYIVFTGAQRTKPWRRHRIFVNGGISFASASDLSGDTD